VNGKSADAAVMELDLGQELNSIEGFEFALKEL